MKKIVINTMTTTGITLIVLSLTAVLYGGKYLCISSVFQAVAANAVIHLGLIFTSRYESRYPILEAGLDITYAAVVILFFGYIFNWYGSTPAGALLTMVLFIYIIGCFISIFRAKEDMEEINRLLRRREDLFKR